LEAVKSQKNSEIAAEQAKVTDLSKKITDIDIWLSKERAKYFNLLEFAPGMEGALHLSEVGFAPNPRSKNYKPTGEYLGYGSIVNRDGPTVKMDAAGLPTVKYGDKFYYNPVTIAQHALMEHGRPGGPSPKFIPAVDYLLGMMGADGALRYEFPFEKYATGEMYQPGWISGMAQGVAISAFTRAYDVTHDHKYLDAAKKALGFMMLPADKGGPLTTLERFPPEPSNAPFIMEYPQSPPVYTLNGYMFSMLGLYDYAAATNDEAVKEFAAKCLDTLKIILPYYDMGSISAYDLSYITIPKNRKGHRSRPHISWPYHAIHVELLWALYNLTGDPVLKETADRWVSYIEPKG
jgi:hypothetical protein